MLKQTEIRPIADWQLLALGLQKKFAVTKLALTLRGSWVDGALRRAGGALRQSGQEIWPFPPLRNATKRDSKVPR